ncbi:type I-E CRISPR-associated protein Cas7/Cse4/CasC [Streptomyces noursei]|uniref:type I-E CRISPR-associated protein Cas7/Cse4/CasC n=1 Tax=Streptomyces noursei TaxID=1971 RepID=UPI00167ACB8A|nr:type I-E CRISPR-associated protein Cas7/Cse4/CasC [Streptomyces noursei]MCZ1018926.1 type I-E CRISPR-associated protein Cas7/Cse4/CasC [Streptomyces noursei]GGX22786.1 type I-E CRISPR-associated protein Cas7/Cse4/CasC [Streptomyces noursei]
MIIELHLLQSFPVSNLNRDDLGQPKTARFGAVTRARISSQSLKRAARDSLDKYGLNPEELGKRSKRHGEKAAEILVERGVGQDFDTACRVTELALKVLGFKLDDKRRLSYLLFLLSTAPRALADACEEHWDTLVRELGKRDVELEKKTSGKTSKVKTEKEWISSLQKSPSGPLLSFKKATQDAFLQGSRQAVDIALFGRMIADHSDKNVIAASQVAHALSTHGVTTDFDYFTALDDFSRGEEPGAGMVGTIEFNAACYYRYANLDLDQLRTNLWPTHKDTEAVPDPDDLVARTVQAWLRAFIHAVPSGKQATMAARTVPETLFAVVRDHGAWNLANAFLKPVTDANDLLAASTDRLLRRYAKIKSFYGDDQIRGSAFHTLADEVPDAANTHHSAVTCDEFVQYILETAGCTR